MKNKGDKINRLFLSSGCLSEEAIELYIGAHASESDKKAIADHLAGCELCSAAVEGYLMLHEEKKDSEIPAIISDLKGKIENRQATRSSRNYMRPVLAIAASLILVVATYMVFRMLYHEKEPVIADLSVSKHTDTQITKLADSINAVIKPDIQSDGQITTTSGNGQGSIQNVKRVAVESRKPAEYNQVQQLKKEEVVVTESPAPEMATQDNGTGVSNTNKALINQKDITINSSQSVLPARISVQDSFILTPGNAYSMNSSAPVSATMNELSYQVSKSKATETLKYTVPESGPEFPGGDDSLKKYFERNIKYPDVNVRGSVYISFYIETNGSVTNISVVKALGGGCDEEAIRLVKLMPKWKPAMQNGKTVRKKVTIPVKFK
jgi:protein TonB